MALLDALRAFFTPPPSVARSMYVDWPDGPAPVGRVVRGGMAERGLTFEQLWGTGRDTAANANTIAGVNVSAETAMNAPAVWACVRLISGAISGMPLHAFREEAEGHKEIRLPDWLERPSPNPNVTRGVHIQALVTSMLLEGNAFVYFLPDVFGAVEARVLDPASVEIRSDRGRTVYRVRGADRDLTPNEIVHIPYLVLPGKERGLNPIDAARESIGLAIAADQYGSAYFGNGATLSGLIEGPPGVDFTPEQIKEMRDSFTKRHVGARKSHAVGMLTGGAAWKDMGKSNKDSQFLELREYEVEDIGRLYGVPPHMIGSQKPGAVAYASVEQRNIDFVTHGLQPVIEKIEDGYDRVLRGSRTYFKFNVDGLLRGDAKSRWESYQIALSNKVMTRDEVREKEDLNPLGLGFLETPNNNPPDAQEPAE